MTGKVQGQQYFLRDVRFHVSGVTIRKRSGIKKDYCFMRSDVQDVEHVWKNAHRVRFLLRLEKCLRRQADAPDVKHVLIFV